MQTLTQRMGLDPFSAYVFASPLMQCLKLTQTQMSSVNKASSVILFMCFRTLGAVRGRQWVTVCRIPAALRALPDSRQNHVHLQLHTRTLLSNTTDSISYRTYTRAHLVSSSLFTSNVCSCNKLLPWYFGPASVIQGLQDAFPLECDFPDE